jgi:hypothetical protein
MLSLMPMRKLLVTAAAEELTEMIGEPEDNVEFVNVDVWGTPREVTELRTALLEVVTKEQPLPESVLDPEREKQALSKCLGVLRESTAKLRAHLQSLEDEGIVDCRIYGET